MKELTFITLDGTTRICSVTDDVRLDYECLISIIRTELSVQDDYRIKVFREGCEDALNPSSNIQSGDKYFVLFQQLDQTKTNELIEYITSNSIDYIIKHQPLKTAKSIIYDKIEELINDGAYVEDIYSMEDYIILDEDYFWKKSVGVGNIQWIMLHIVRYNDMALLKLLLNNGLKINSPPIKKYFTYTGLMRDNIINILLLYKVDLKYHYDIKSDISMIKLGCNHRLVAHAISENILELNTIISFDNSISDNSASDNSAFYYYIHKLDEFLHRYKYSVDHNLPSFDGNTFLSMGSLYSNRKNLFEYKLNKCPQFDINLRYYSNSKRVFEHKMKKYPQIDVNLQYHITYNEHAQPGDTILHMLCRGKQLNVGKIRMLLDKGARLIKNDNGETQLDVLRKLPYKKQRNRILKLLEKYFNVVAKKI